MAGIPRRLRERLEDGLRADLGAVRLVLGDPARVACARAAAVGLAMREGILLPQDDPEAPGAAAIIAHEAVHVVQKRLPGASVEAHAEAEARAAVPILLAGGRLRPAMPSAPDRISCWKEIGHYYTVYLVALAAGVEVRRAADIAFFAQLPDEAEELDAFEQAKAMLATNIAASQEISANPFFAGPAIERQQNQQKQTRVIQEGLHALTGLPVATERKRRDAIMQGLVGAGADFVLDFGLACHPYADVFAHQHDGVMYGFPLGHGLHFSKPDMVSKENFGRYKDYVTSLYGHVRAKVAVGAPTRLAADALVSRLQGLPKLDGERSQAIEIRNIAKGMGAAMCAYDPMEEDARPIWQVAKGYPAYFTSRDKVMVLARAVALARRWMPKR